MLRTFLQKVTGAAHITFFVKVPATTAWKSDCKDLSVKGRTSMNHAFPFVYTLAWCRRLDSPQELTFHYCTFGRATSMYLYRTRWLIVLWQLIGGLETYGWKVADLVHVTLCRSFVVNIMVHCQKGSKDMLRWNTKQYIPDCRTQAASDQA